MMKYVWVALLSLMLAGACFAQGAATVIFASGGAQIIGKDGEARAAQRGAVLEAGETVDTRDGRVQLRFRDGASMSLQVATRFRVDEFRYVEQSGKASADDRGFFSLLKGGFRTLTGLIGKHQREQYKVDAVVATIGIRGTDYSANLSDAGLAVSTFAGVVEVCSAAACAQVAPGETVIVADRHSAPHPEKPRSGGSDAPPALGPPGSVESPPVALPVQIPAAAAAGGSSPSVTTAPTTSPVTASPYGR